MMKTIISILLLIPLLCGVGTAQTYHATLCPTDDAYVDSESPASNYGGASRLYVETDIWSSSPDYMRSYLKFDLSQIPVEPNITTTIISANLKLRCSYISGSSVSVGAYQCSNSWSEDTITWNSTPTSDLTPIDIVLVVHDYTWYAWDVAESVQDSISDNISIMLKSERIEYGTESLSFYSKDYSTTYIPKLEITYTLSCSCSDASINITDSDSDGVIDILDWDNSTPSGYWTDSHGQGRMWGDLNGDGELTSADALMILQAAVGAIKL